MKADYDYAIKNQMIDMFGMQSPEDIKFKYMVDNGKLTGPALLNQRRAQDGYRSSVLSLWNFVDRNTRGEWYGKVKAPFSSAKWGPRPTDSDPWLLERSSIPLGLGTGIDSLVRGAPTQANYDRQVIMNNAM